MLSINDITFFRKTLFEWYDLNKRILPWREIKNPYLIWISEIILQQTQVAQGTAYFLRFTERFPTVESLAKADIDEVLKLWQGLGYYSRAHNLHLAANEILERHGGIFPENHAEIRALRGIGDYTAAAIASFAYNLPFAAIDGNVYRFLSRFFGIFTPIDSTNGKKEFAELANFLLEKEFAGKQNQATMEFGALQCTPHAHCDNCPLQTKCAAFAQNCVELLPVKTKKTKVRNRYFFYICVYHDGKTYLQKRSNREIWKGLFEFPMIETQEPLSIENLLENEKFHEIVGGDFTILQQFNTVKHVLSHQHIFAQCVCVEAKTKSNFLQNCSEIDFSEIGNFAVSRLTEKFLEKIRW